MDGRRDQLLAGAALAVDQHRGVGRRDLHDDVLHLGHTLGGPDEVADAELLAEAAAEAVHLLTQEATLNDMTQTVSQLLQNQRLHQVVVRTELERLDRGRDRGVPRHHQDLDGRVVTLHLAEEVDTAHPGHPDVQEADLEQLGAQELERFAGRAGGRHLVAPHGEDLRQEVPEGLVVIHHEDVRPLHQSASPPRVTAPRLRDVRAGERGPGARPRARP